MRRVEDDVVRSGPWGGMPVVSGELSPSPGRGLQQSLPAWPVIWAACVRRTHAWRTPPRWSPRDWWEEIDAEGVAAAFQAIRVFDPSRGPSLNSFVYHQILSTALARYRREWNYALRCKPSSADLETLSSSVDQAATDHEEERLTRSIRGLSEADRQMVERLFWERWTEEEVAGSLGVSQQAVSRRKRKILLALRQSLKADGM